MSGGPVGVGIIGAGVISNQYLENLTAFPDLDVRFVADIDLDRAKAQAEKYGVPGSGTVEELLADDGIEIVVNLTIPKVHVDVATIQTNSRAVTRSSSTRPSRSSPGT